MRLVNKATLALEWFNDGQEPPYVILSHCWRGRETSLQEYTAQINKDKDTWTDGVSKIVRFCEQVGSRKEDFVWVDTCCIDKTSSTELQEAINSMYKWYEQAQTCFVFLDDVKFREDVTRTRKSLEKSRWFTRGWTLQELVAPRDITFLDKNCTLIGHRADLMETIAHITGIPTECFGNHLAIHAMPIAKRMSWLSDRETTRVEDLAYCMLGIFDVSMNMLYGEGRKAFLRLQKELLETIDDESIFLWMSQELPEGSSSILAPHPSCFREAHGLAISIHDHVRRDATRITAKGMMIEVYMPRSAKFRENIKLPLNCLIDGRRACIELQHVRAENEGGHHLAAQTRDWYRISCNIIQTLDESKWSQEPSDFTEYNEQRRKVQNALRSSNAAPGLNAYTAMREWENEQVKFKIWVK